MSDLLKVIEELLKYYRFDSNEFVAIKSLRDGLHPLGILISIILSQNTSDKNALKALSNLRRKLGMRLEPIDFRGVDVREIEDLIRPSGMYRLKAKTIINVVRRFSGNDDLMKLEPSRLREELLSVPGVGPKTADVFLLMVRKYPTFPIDTHIRRVLTRLGLIKPNTHYEAIREYVMKSLPPNLYLPAHLVLIKHGRTICRARGPKCDVCPISKYCRYFRENR